MKRWNACQGGFSFWPQTITFGSLCGGLSVFLRFCFVAKLISTFEFYVFAYKPCSDGRAWVFPFVLWQREWTQNPQYLFHFHGFPSRVCQGYEPNWADCTVQAAGIGGPWAATDSAAALSTDKGNKWQDGIRQCATKLNHCQGSRDLKDLSGLLKHKTDWFHLLSIISYWGEQEALKESESNVISGIFKHLSFQLETIMY